MEAGIGDEEWAQRTCGFYVAAQPLLTRRKDLKSDLGSPAEEYLDGGQQAGNEFQHGPSSVIGLTAVRTYQ